MRKSWSHSQPLGFMEPRGRGASAKSRTNLTCYLGDDGHRVLLLTLPCLVRRVLFIPSEVVAMQQVPNRLLSDCLQSEAFALAPEPNLMTGW